MREDGGHGICGSNSFHELRQYVPDEVQTGFETLFDDSLQTQNKVLLQSSDDNTDHSLQMGDGYCGQSSLLNEALTE